MAKKTKEIKKTKAALTKKSPAKVKTKTTVKPVAKKTITLNKPATKKLTPLPKHKTKRKKEVVPTKMNEGVLESEDTQDVLTEEE